MKEHQVKILKDELILIFENVSKVFLNNYSDKQMSNQIENIVKYLNFIINEKLDDTKFNEFISNMKNKLTRKMGNDLDACFTKLYEFNKGLKSAFETLNITNHLNESIKLEIKTVTTTLVNSFNAKLVYNKSIETNDLPPNHNRKIFEKIINDIRSEKEYHKFEYSTDIMTPSPKDMPLRKRFNFNEDNSKVK